MSRENPGEPALTGVDASVDAGAANISPHGGQALDDLMRRRMRQLNLNQTELAERAGMTRAYLHRLARGGVVNPGVLTLQRLAQALDVPAAALVRLWIDSATCARSQHLCYVALQQPDDILMFLGDVTVPDHSLVMPGERFTKTWAIQNVGKVWWPARRLVREDVEMVVARRERHGGLTPLLDAYLASLDRVVEVPATPPGAVVELSVDFAAPLENCSVASLWQLQSLQGTPCYDSRFFLQVIVTVKGA